MKSMSIEKFGGLHVQENSFALPDGSLERAENVLISRDNIISKRRGNRSAYYLPQEIAAIVDYKSDLFAVGTSNIFRFDEAQAGVAYSFAGSSQIAVRKLAHGLNDGDYITDFVTQTEAFVSQYPYRYADFAGQPQITTAFSGLTASVTAGIVTITQGNHGLQNGDRVVVGTNDVSATGGLAAITRISASQYSFASVGASGTGSCSLNFYDSFLLQAANNAAAAATGTSASWDDYKALAGAAFAVTTFCPTVKSNGNLYFGTDSGVRAIEQVAGSVRTIGVPPGLDLDAYLSGNSGGVSPRSQTAYRVLFGNRDSNQNLHLGAPSEAFVITNDVTTVPAASLSYASGTTILTVTGAGGISNGDLVYFYNTVATPAGVAGPGNGDSLAATGVTGTVFTVKFSQLGISAVTGVSSLEYSTRKTATVYSSIPSEISATGGFYQVYRAESTAIQSDGTIALPTSSYQLVDQISLTSTDISQGFVTYVDELPQEVIASNAELYTNPTQEGELQSNDRPPLCADLTLFKGYVFYGSCTPYRELSLSLIDTTVLANGNLVTLAGTTFIFRNNATNASCGNAITTSSVSIGGTTATVTQVAHGFSSNDVIYVISSGTNAVTTGLKTITVATPDTFTFTCTTGSTTSTLVYEGRKNSSNQWLVKLTKPSDTDGATIAEAIDLTARALCKAINRNTANKLYAEYVSAASESPGRMLFTAKSASEATFAATAQDTTVGSAFSPALPASGVAVSDTLDAQLNALLCAKYLEPEAVPQTNIFPIGSKDSPIYRAIALRDSLIILKGDGVFRLNGDSLSNWVVTALDTTVVLKAVRSVAVLNNSVFCLTNQGVVQITDTSVRIISRPIEPLLTAILGRTELDAYTSGVAYESERLYILSTIEASTTPTEANISYVYNYLTDSWTTFNGLNVENYVAFVDSADSFYSVKASDKKDVIAERKQINKIDYTEQHTPIQCYVAQVANATAMPLAPGVTIVVPEGHGVLQGDVLTILQCDSTLAAAYSSGASAVNGLRLVAATTDTTIEFDALESSLNAAVGTLYWQRGISEVSLTAIVTNGSKIVSIATSVAHGLVTGDAVTIDSLSTAVAAAFSAPADLLGFRPINVTDLQTFTVSATNAASGGATDTVSLRDNRGILNKLTVFFAAQPQTGDTLVTNSRIYKVTDVLVFKQTTGQYVLTLGTDFLAKTTDLVFLHDRYSATVKFSPLTFGTGMLSQFSEFQAWFRNDSSCSRVNVNFATDSRFSDKNIQWTTFVGTPAGLVPLGGWGQPSWGNFAWGGGTSVALNFTTGPAVPLRTYVPKASYLATFIQPVLRHEMGGEPFELQSITLIGKPGTQRVSK